MDLFSQFDNLEKEFFGLSKMQKYSTDIRDEGSKFVVESELPGFRKEDISLDINGDTLTISAKHNSIKEEKSDENSDNSKDGNSVTTAPKYLRRERTFSSYQRNFDISAVNADEISAEYTNGVLTLDLPKKEAKKPAMRSISIN
jgi:HSP20 family protein